MHDLSFVEISRRLRALALPSVDLVVGVQSGGAVPAALAAFILDRPLRMIGINFRAADNSPCHPQPVLRAPFPELPADVGHVLLVDDVSVSGGTLALARACLGDRRVSTLVLKGKADYVLFPEIAGCVAWPWKGGLP
jgi:hypoxanthine phosphoribosyltransferase